LLLFRATGYDSLYQDCKVELAGDERTLDVVFHAFSRNHRTTSRVLRADLDKRTVETIADIEGVSTFTVHWNATHTWAVLSGYRDKFHYESDPSLTIFVSPVTHERFELPSSASVFAVAFDDKRGKAYVGSAVNSEVW